MSPHSGNPDDEQGIAPGGSRLFRHGGQRSRDATVAAPHIEEISRHIETHLGEIGGVFQEIVSDGVRIDVHAVPPTVELPCLRLVTSGMSDLPMAMPEGMGGPDRMELMITLPADWRTDQTSFQDENWYWPIRLLKFLARLPHLYDTWLGFGHTIPNGDPPAPYASNVRFDGAIILPPLSAPDDFGRLELEDGGTIVFMTALPLYPEEMALKLDCGTDALLERLDKRKAGDIADPRRANAAKKRFGLF
ncbi:MAG: suppressor of fused domain protein [Xanthomonadaceae bacterium]|jgi:hypothetical protein|nr:suppressor of fused domain protein [Xanthomonadaceae bacterium]